MNDEDTEGGMDMLKLDRNMAVVLLVALILGGAMFSTMLEMSKVILLGLIDATSNIASTIPPLP